MPLSRSHTLLHTLLPHVTPSTFSKPSDCSFAQLPLDSGSDCGAVPNPRWVAPADHQCWQGATSIHTHSPGRIPYPPPSRTHSPHWRLNPGICQGGRITVAPPGPHVGTGCRPCQTNPATPAHSASSAGYCLHCPAAPAATSGGSCHLRALSQHTHAATCTHSTCLNMPQRREQAHAQATAVCGACARACSLLTCARCTSRVCWAPGMWLGAAGPTKQDKLDRKQNSCCDASKA